MLTDIVDMLCYIMLMYLNLEEAFHTELALQHKLNLFV
jgi:hypothetical protein